MTKSQLSKTLTLVGGFLSASALSSAYGPKWSTVVATFGTALVSLGATLASSTSVAHPNG